MADLFVGLGSNLGDRPRFLRSSVSALQSISGMRLRQCSQFYLTHPFGGPLQPNYLNAVARFETSCSPQETLCFFQKVELQYGRRRVVENGPRTLDLDLLWYGGISWKDAHLVLPHPRMGERDFVLRPLTELAPHLPLPDGTAQQCLHQLQLA